MIGRKKGASIHERLTFLQKSEAEAARTLRPKRKADKSELSADVSKVSIFPTKCHDQTDKEFLKSSAQGQKSIQAVDSEDVF